MRRKTCLNRIDFRISRLHFWRVWGQTRQRGRAMLYGYARVSSTGQDLAVQTEALTAAGCTVIRSEKMSGTTRQGRTELDTVLDFLRAGDTLVVTKVDRLARSIADLQGIVATLKEKGAALRTT